jgi:hypothetical protein
MIETEALQRKHGSWLTLLDIARGRNGLQNSYAQEIEEAVWTQIYNT